MKKIFLFIIAFSFFFSVQAQQFDSLSYLETYKNNFSSFYYGNSLTDEAKISGLSRAWSEAKFNFANFDLVKVLNWDSLYFAYIPKVLVTENYTDYYKVLMQFFTHLNDGHSLIVPPKFTWDTLNAGLPIRTRLIENQVVITVNQSEDKAYSKLKRGTIIHRINGLETAEYAKKFIAPYISYSTPQDSVARLLSFFLTKGSLYEPIEMEISYKSDKKETLTLSRQITEDVFHAAKGFYYKPVNKETNILTINTFNDAQVVPFYDSIFSKLPHPKNLIIDLRNNGGGNSNNGFELIGYLRDKPFLMGLNVVRKYVPPFRAWGNYPDNLEYLQYDWKPYKGNTFTGNVVVLIGPDTYSAAEDFLVVFKEINRGKIIGQPTGGSTGQPLFFPLPAGGMGYVCSKRDLFVDGGEFIGIGIHPDIPVQYSLQNFLKSNDEAIQKALEYFKSLND